MADALTGLSPESRSIVSCYQQWSRLAYDNLRRNVHLDASNHQVGNILQETYTREEVKAIISAHTAVLLHSLDTRMQLFTSASSALLYAILRDADRQRITIEIDANNVLLTASTHSNSNNSNTTAPFSTTPTSTAASAYTTTTTMNNNNMNSNSNIGITTTTTSGLLDDEGLRLLNGPRGRLAPLTVADAAGAAQLQLAEANAEVRRLQEKLHRLSDEYTRVMQNRTAETEQFRSMQDTLATTRNNTNNTTHTNTNNSNNTSSSNSKESELQNAGLQQTVQQLRAEVAAVRQELNTRLSQSTQYQQLKKILARKNEQIKTMRSRLIQYDPAFLSQDGGDVGEAEETDL